MGDYLLRRGMMALGLSARSTFAVTAVLGMLAQLAGAMVMAGGRSRIAGAAVFAMALTPAWCVFFTGYVEDYAIPAGLAFLAVALAARGRSIASVSAAVAAAGAFHLAALMLLPLLVSYALAGRRSPLVPPSAAAACAACVAFATISLAAGGIPRDLPSPGLDPVGRLRMIVFCTPFVAAAPLLVRRRPSRALVAALAASLLAFFLFPFERGVRLDWDLAGLLLTPAFAALLALSGDGRLVLPSAAVLCAALAGPRISIFLDPGQSEEMYLSAASESRDAGAIEEYAILLRSRGLTDEAAALFHRAWDVTGNGRHLSQEAEALRMSGRPAEALGVAMAAAASRPDVETVWLELALSARDAGAPREAVRAAVMVDSLFTSEAGGLWGLALETAVSCSDTGLAIESAQRALASGDSRPSTLVNAGIAAFWGGDSAAAEARFRRALELDPGNIPAARNLQMLGSAGALLRRD